jgi:hypothetical protein
MNPIQRFGLWLAGGREQFAITPNLTTDDHWRSMTGGRHDRDPGDLKAQYDDALTAWRKNPMAWRIIQITTDYTVSNGISLTSSDPHMARFIESFWFHPENNINLRLEGMSDELARAGDIFPVLFRERHTGISRIRFLTKDQIQDIETKKNDWERETAVIQNTNDPTRPKRWVTPHNPRNGRYKAVALHYHINRPIGSLYGESDLATILPWLLRYSRMLEDRVRFHWGSRLFLWLVRVPRQKVKEKAEQYKYPPEAGSVIVHDESEEWKTQSPVLRGSDAAPDLKAVRNMIDAGSGYPPHWRGEAADVNLATAQAMQEPAERHLVRRQTYFIWMLQDITYQAYVRAHQAHPEIWPAIEENQYKYLFEVHQPDVTKMDNTILAQATQDLAGAFDSLQAHYPNSPTLRRTLLRLILKFAGEAQDDEVLDQVMKEAGTPQPAEEKTAVQDQMSAIKTNGAIKQ